jgi:hypothetical protein
LTMAIRPLSLSVRSLSPNSLNLSYSGRDIEPRSPITCPPPSPHKTVAETLRTHPSCSSATQIFFCSAARAGWICIGLTKRKRNLLSSYDSIYSHIHFIILLIVAVMVLTSSHTRSLAQIRRSTPSTLAPMVPLCPPLLKLPHDYRE